jgi:hypothetical protein
MLEFCTTGIVISVITSSVSHKRGLHGLVYAIFVYPFNPVVAIPSVNCFWVRKYSTSTGIKVMTAPAISKWVSGPASVTNDHKPTISGLQVSLVVTNSGQRKAFQEPMKANKMTVAIGALLIGSTIVHRKRR